MKVSLNWLKDFLDFDLAAEEVAEVLTNLGLEVEAIEYPDDFSRVVVGLVESCELLPDGKNRLCRVNVGWEKLSIVCGAPNVKAQQLVPVALPEGKLPDGRVIKVQKIAGHKSQGMICSQAELRLGGQADKIWELDKDIYRDTIAIPGTDLRNKFPGDAVFKLEITHNRPDCLSHYGVARDLAAGLGLKLKPTPSEVREIETPTDLSLSVEISAAQKCPRYCGRLMQNVEVNASPRWMQRRLMAVGLRPINNIVDITNYVMLEYGHPLHAFDYTLIEQGRIEVKTAAEGEKFVTLDEKEHLLTADDLLICDGEKAVALAGVMGGLNSEISPDTSDILIECAYFEPVGIRRTAKRLNLVTDSSYRFERGVDPNAVPMVIDRAARLMKETAGGEILSGRVDNYILKINPKRVKLRPRRVNYILGLNLKKPQIIDYLERLELKTANKDNALQVKIPTFRPDIFEEIDLIEEIIRIHGYDKVKTSPRSNVELEVEPLSEEKFDSLIKSSLIELGLYEVLNNTMRHLRRAGLNDYKAVAISNPISADFALLRTDLLASLLETAAYNLNQGAESIRFFELGKVFREIAEGKIEEKKRLSGILIGSAEETHWSAAPKLFDFYYLKGIVDNFLQRISLEHFIFTSKNEVNKYYQYALSVMAMGEPVGSFGKLTDEVRRTYEIELPAFVFDFDYDALLRHYQSDRKFTEFSRHPAVKRDLSFIFAEEVAALEIEKSISFSGGEYLKSITFFDLYHGKQIGIGEKSISFSLQFQARERTLTDEEVDSFIEQISANLQNLGGELRDR